MGETGGGGGGGGGGPHLSNSESIQARTVKLN